MPHPKSKHSKSASQIKDPWAVLDAINENLKEPKGEEWFTVNQYASRYKLTRSSANFRIMKMVSDGILEKWSGSGVSSSGIKKTMNKYRLK